MKMEATREEHASDLPEINEISTADLFECLKNGWHDYKSAPAVGLFFAAFYVANRPTACSTSFLDPVES